jgi:hypothetical protein
MNHTQKSCALVVEQQQLLSIFIGQNVVQLVANQTTFEGMKRNNIFKSSLVMLCLYIKPNQRSIDLQKLRRNGSDIISGYIQVN